MPRAFPPENTPLLAPPARPRRRLRVACCVAPPNSRPTPCPARATHVTVSCRARERQPGAGPRRGGCVRGSLGTAKSAGQARACVATAAGPGRLRVYGGGGGAVRACALYLAARESRPSEAADLVARFDAARSRDPPARCPAAQAPLTCLRHCDRRGAAFGRCVRGRKPAPSVGRGLSERAGRRGIVVDCTHKGAAAVADHVVRGHAGRARRRRAGRGRE